MTRGDVTRHALAACYSPDAPTARRGSSLASVSAPVSVILVSKSSVTIAAVLLSKDLCTFCYLQPCVCVSN